MGIWEENPKLEHPERVGCVPAHGRGCSGIILEFSPTSIQCVTGNALSAVCHRHTRDTQPRLFRALLVVPGACARHQTPGKEQEWQLRLCVSLGWAGRALLVFYPSNSPGAALCFPRSKQELIWLHIPGIAPGLLPGPNSGSAAGPDTSTASTLVPSAFAAPSREFGGWDFSH